MNGPESRDTLATSFKEVFDDINEIQESGFVTIEGNRVDIELFLGGDYKVRCEQLYFGHYPMFSNFSPNIVLCKFSIWHSQNDKKKSLSFCDLM